LAAVFPKKARIYGKDRVFNSISRSQLNDKAAVRLICLPHAGGGTASYHRWRPLMPANVDLLPLALPGHDGRLNQPLATDLKVLARDLTEELGRFALDRPFVVMGHSMGALLAHEIARALRRAEHAMPRLLVLTGCRPPHTIVVQEPIHTLPDAEFISLLQERYGGMPPAIRDNAELQAILVPALRADFQMIETYSCDDEPPLDVPMLVLGGAEDPAVSASHLMEWRQYTTRECSVRLLPGGHFFVFSSGAGSPTTTVGRVETPSAALRIILTQLEQIAANVPVVEQNPSS